MVAGVSYLIDNLSGGCQWSALKDSAMAFYKNVNSRQVRMETPREFFIDNNINYQYAGSVSAWSWSLGIYTILPSLCYSRADRLNVTTNKVLPSCELYAVIPVPAISTHL